MAVGGKPNAEYVLDSLMANLGLISTAGEYWIDVKTVKMPNYEPLADSMFTEDPPAIMVWVAGEFQVEGLIGRAERAMDVWIYGLVSGDHIQVQLLRLMASLRKCLLSNRQLDFPGTSGVTNTWGRGLDETAEEVSYQVESGDQSRATGLLFSKWRIKYAFPREG